MSNFKKFVAFSMAATMLVGGSLTAFAEGETATDQTSAAAVELTGAGTDVYVNKEVYKLNVPTGAGLTSAFAYTVDSQGLLAETAASGVTIEEGAGILFNDAENSYASTSKKVVLTNKSSVGVSLAIEAKMDATSKSYAGGYSTTADFDGTDSTKGVYFGLIASNELEKPLDTSAKTFSNAVLSAADKYEVKAPANAGDPYTYALKSDATGFPTYEFQMKAALNNDMAESTWATVASDGAVTLVTMPTISVKFTPTAITGVKPATAIVEGENIYIAKQDATDGDGGFGTTKPTAILVNGKSISTVSNNEDGYAVVTWKDVYTAWGYTDTTIAALSDEEQTAIWESVKSIKVTSTLDYYVELNK